VDAVWEPRRRHPLAALALAAGLVAAGEPAALAVGLAATEEVPPTLEQVTAALEREAAGLQRLAERGGLRAADGAAAVQGYLADVEVRLWRLEIEAAAALEVLMGDGAESPPESPAGLPAQLLAAVEARVRTGAGPLAGVLSRWHAFERALSRARALQAGLAAAAREAATGLPVPGRTCPVAGPHHFTSTWAEDRPWGREHKGEDLHAQLGTPLVAMESGTIVQAGWHWAGGVGVYLEGHYSGDVYYYAHLLSTAPGIRVGVVVQAGDPIGWVGATGNADSPHLHLGWVPDNPGPWVDLDYLADPYPLLVGLCRSGWRPRARRSPFGRSAVWVARRGVMAMQPSREACTSVPSGGEKWLR